MGHAACMGWREKHKILVRIPQRRNQTGKL